MKKSVVFLLVIVLILSSCQQNIVPKQSKTKESAETIADKFGRYWEQKDYSSMYDQFIPELQKLKTKDDFIKLMNYIEKDSNPKSSTSL